MTTNESLMVYRFGKQTDGSASMKNLLGGKGANLAEMSSLGIPVPPGFTIPCHFSVSHGSHGLSENVLDGLYAEMGKALEELENEDGMLPLVSVRSGARVSMPGMMDTILNVGLCESTLDYWKDKIGERTALDSYRRLIQMYSSVALGVPMEQFDAALDDLKESANVHEDKDLDVGSLGLLVSSYLSIVESNGKKFPQDPLDQIRGAMFAVFDSWNNPRAIEYRKINDIPEDWGTAVTVQSMVFGNWNDNSATGVLFSRDPSTGGNYVTGEFLVNAQGEDVVAGIRTPELLGKMADWNPSVFNDLMGVVNKLEGHYKDMQDIEFTVQDGKLYLLQTRNGKRSAKAAFKIAYDLAKDGTITKEQAFKRVNKEQLIAIMQDTIDPTFKKAPDFMGIAAGGGLVTGAAVFTSDAAINCTVPCILVRKETDPDDIGGMHKSLGILTATGGLTSHAAVVARGMNKSCVVGSTSMSISGANGYVDGKKLFTAGDTITIDGGTGNVWVKTKVPVIPGGATPEIRELLSWGKGDSITRVTLTPGMQAPEIIEAMGGAAQPTSVYFDTALLINGPDEKNVMGEVLQYIVAAVTLTGCPEAVIDLHDISTYYDQPDTVTDLMFGLGTIPGLVGMDKYGKVLNALKGWDTDTVMRVSLKLPPDFPLVMRASLQKKGFKILSTTQVKTFADLLSATGAVQIDEDAIKAVFGTQQAWEAAKTLVQDKTGIKLENPAINPRYWYDMGSTTAGA